MASLGGDCSFTKSGKPIAKQSRKKPSGTPTKNASWIAFGSTCGVVCVSERRR